MVQVLPAGGKHYFQHRYRSYHQVENNTFNKVTGPTIRWGTLLLTKIQVLPSGGKHYFQKDTGPTIKWKNLLSAQIQVLPSDGKTYSQQRYRSYHQVENTTLSTYRFYHQVENTSFSKDNTTLSTYRFYHQVENASFSKDTGPTVRWKTLLSAEIQVLPSGGKHYFQQRYRSCKSGWLDYFQQKHRSYHQMGNTTLSQNNNNNK